MLLSLLSFVFGAALCGCQERISVPSVHSTLDAPALISVGDTSYQCQIRYINKETASLTFTSPDSLSGLTVSTAQGSCSYSLGSLLCKKTLPVPENSAAKKVFDAFRLLSDDALTCQEQSSDGSYVFYLPDDPRHFKLTTDKDGFPLLVQNDSIRITLSSADSADTLQDAEPSA